MIARGCRVRLCVGRVGVARWMNVAVGVLSIDMYLYMTYGLLDVIFRVVVNWVGSCS